MKKVLPLLQERTPGLQGMSRRESLSHTGVQAQKKQRIEEEQRNKTGRPGSSNDPEPEKEGSTQHSLHSARRGRGHK